MSTNNDNQNALASDDVGDNAIEAKETEGLSQGKIVFRKFLRHKGAMISIGVFAFVALFAFSSVGFGPIPGWWIYNHTASGPIVNAGGAPTWSFSNFFSLGDHPFGQDEIGRDNFARVMKGTQISIIVMIIIGLVCLVIGTIVGAVAGYYRGWIDSLLMRITDGFIILPGIVIGSIFVITIVMGDPVDLSDLAGRTDTRAAREATERIMDAVTALVQGLRGEQAPHEIWDPRRRERVPRRSAAD